MANNLLVSNTYFTAQQYVNPTEFSTAQPALVDEKLLFPIIKSANDYQVAIGKASLPLDTIPLTNSNIPLKRYEVVLRQGSLEGSAYLRQVNANNSDFVWNCSPTGVVVQYIYQASGTLQPVTTIDCSSFVPNGVQFFLVDDYKNAYFATSTIALGLVNIIKVVNLTSISLLTELSLTFIKGMDLDRSNNLYVADETSSASVVNVYDNQNSAESVILTLIETITEDLDGNPLTAIRTVAADQSLLVGYDSNKFCIYSITSYLPQSGFTNSSIFQMGQASAINSSGQGTFCVTDTGGSDEFFIGNKTPASGNNSFNMITEAVYENTATWLPESKFALAPASGFGFSIGSDSNLYAFPYSTSTNLPTGTPVLINSAHTYYNLAQYQTNDLMLAYGTNLGGFNLNQESPPSQTFGLIDGDFRVGGVGAGTAPIAFDFQPTSNRILAVTATNTLAITTQPIYPKNFFTVLSDPIEVINQFYRYGVGYNAYGTSVATPVITADTETINPLVWIDGFQQVDGTNSILCTNTVFDTYNINGTSTGSYTATGLTNVIACCSTGAADRVCCIDATGNLAVYNTTTGVQTQAPIATGLTSVGGVFPYIFGGRDVTNGIYFIVIAYGYSLHVYTSANGSSGYTLSFTQATVTPTGAPAQTWFYSGFVLNESSGGVKIGVLCSGTASTPSSLTVQRLCTLVFNSTYTSLTSATLVGTAGVFSINNHALTGSSEIGEFYIQNAPAGGGVFNGTITTVSASTYAVTSTMTFPNAAQGNASPFFPVECTKNNGYYAWQSITTTGASSFYSVSFSRQHPNTVYALDTAGAVWKGTLSGASIAFQSYTLIPSSAAYRSISAFPSVETYNSTVSCFSISNQQAVGTPLSYTNQLVSSIGKNDVSQNFVIAVQDSKLEFVNSTTFASPTQALLSTANLVFSKAGEDVDAGKAPIYDFQVFINALNAALAEAKTRLGGTLVSAPVASMDYQTQLFTLSYSSDYTLAGNGILFNPALWRIVQFYYKPDLIDVGFYKLQLPLNSTSLVQTHKSAYLFNKLRKILFQSNTIYVAGSFQGINAQNQVITDIDVITDSFIDNQGQVLFFQPNILRPYQMNSNNSVDRIQLRILYEYVDGEQNQLLLNPDSGFSALLTFIKRS